jgi:transposase
MARSRWPVRWRKRQYRCRELACPRKAFTESVAEIPPRARLTGRLGRQLARQVASGRSVSAVAAELGVSWPVAHRHYAAHADGLLTEPSPPVVLGIDETRRGKPKWVQDAASGRWVRTERFETNFTDLSGDGRLLGQVAGRTGKAVTGWLEDRSQDWKDQVAFVAIDPCAVYRTAVTRSLPHAVIVVDHFHLVRLANQAVTRVRQRVTRQVFGRRGTTRDPAWANRRRLLRGRERLTDQAYDRMWTEILAQEATGELLATWIAKEESATCWPWPARSRPAQRSVTGCSRSTTGAPALTSPRSPPWPRRLRPGGRRSSRSSTPASPTPPPKPATGSSKTPPGSRSGSATSTTSAAEYGCTANGQ